MLDVKERGNLGGASKGRRQRWKWRRQARPRGGSGGELERYREEERTEHTSCQIPFIYLESPLMEPGELSRYSGSKRKDETE